MLGKEKTENYLKVIYRLQKMERSARGVDIAYELGVSRPTVSVAVKELEKEGYITTDSGSSAVLTEKGLAVAMSVTEKYSFFIDMLRFLNVSPSTAKIDACQLEHSLSDESFTALQKFF